MRALAQKRAETGERKFFGLSSEVRAVEPAQKDLFLSRRHEE
jgi:hypothetical protein